VSLLALALSTLVYGLASYLQAVGIARAPAGSPGLARLARGMASWPFLAGVGLDLVGVGLGGVALRELPLFLVQAAGVASVGVTAVLATLAGQQTDRTRLARGLLAGTVGCALLTAAAEPAPAASLPDLTRLALVVGIPVAGAVALVAARRAPRADGLVLTTISGLAFAGVGLCQRGGGAGSAEAWHLGLAPAFVLGITGTVLFAVALERTPVTAATAVLAFTELVVPAAVGLLTLGDRVREGFGPVAALGCALVALALRELTAAEGGADAGRPDPAAWAEPAGPWARTVLPARR
jgi:drug/metabolite transporter (DMT)-like permease